jgi:ketopantoate reductase
MIANGTRHEDPHLRGGVIGQIYAARLHEAGHEVTVLARHPTLQTLTQDGITLVNQARPDPLVQRVPVRVEVTGEVGPTARSSWPW